MPDPAVGITVVLSENTLNKSRVFGIVFFPWGYLFCINIRSYGINDVSRE